MSETNPALDARRLIEEALRVLERASSQEQLEKMETALLRHKIEEALRGLWPQGPASPSWAALCAEVEAYAAGLGLLERLLADPMISDILINGTETLFIERGGRLEELPFHFERESELDRIVRRLLRRIGREFDPDQMMYDLRMRDGSRVNIIMPPLTLGGPTLSIRRFVRSVASGEDLVRNGAMPQELLDFFGFAVRGKLNIIVCGGTGTGKTTMLNVLSSFIPNGERIVTIEDAAELSLHQRHVVRLETRPGFGGKSDITARDLFRNCLRMRPDRILIGEVRGAEVLDMMQAMNSGHEGSMTTLHANNPRDALIRIEALLRMAGMELSEAALAQSLSRSFHLFIQLARLSDGRRVVQSVQEVVGREASVVTMQELFTFQIQGTDKNGRVQGQFRSTGVRPQFYDRLRRTLGGA